MKKIFYLIGISALLASCSKEDETTGASGDDRIVFGSSIEAGTRAIADNATQFGNGDQIGVIGYRADVEGETTDFSAPFMDRKVFTYNSTGGKFTSNDASALWQRGKAHNFYAYYPSNLTINTLTTAAPTATLAVTAGTGIGIDVMQAAAKTAVYDKSSSSAALAFSHRLSKVRFEVKKEVNVSESILTKVEFSMAKNSGSFNVATGAVANSGGSVVLRKSDQAQEITTTAASAFGAEWIVLPADVISNVKLTINGLEHTATNLTGTATAVGKITTITITVKATTGIEMTSSITPWGNEAGSGDLGGPSAPAKIGDYYYSDKTYSTAYDNTKTCIGIVYKVNADRKSGKIISFDEAMKTAWSTENIDTGATSKTDGVANTAKVLALPSYTAEKYPAFAWCAAKNATAPAGIEWYIPAVEEMHQEVTSIRVTLNAVYKLATGSDMFSNDTWMSTQLTDNVANRINETSISNNYKYSLMSVRAVSAF